MSREPDLQALVLQLGEQAIAPVNGSLAHRARLYGDAPVGHSTRRVIYEREQTHLFGRRTWERFTIELDELP
jgi:hypothetical protein